MIATTATCKLETLQRMFSELQDEMLSKNEALKAASFQIVTLKSERESLSGSTGVGTMDQLKFDMKALREKIGIMEDERRK